MIESLMPVIAAFIYFFKSKNKLKMYKQLLKLTS